MPAMHDHAPPSPSGSATSDTSSNSVSSSGPPRTPVSTTLPLAMPTFMNFTGEDTINGVTALNGVKRTSKTTRRVNTAERRATHNAVERARRETLNGRFLDLAGLLPNLSQIRRPSKSAIVNSSIAHLNASRRHRILAAQQLRMMKNEADVLRHEVNEWRARAGMPFVEEPMRCDAFGIVLRGELEFEAADMLDGNIEEAEYDDEEAGGVYGGNHHYASEQTVYTEEPTAEEYALLQRQQQEQLATPPMQAPFSHTAAHPSPPQGYPVHQIQRASAPSVPSPHFYTASPTIVSASHAAFENPAIGGYEQQQPYSDTQPTAIHNGDWVAFEKRQRLQAHPHPQHGW